VTTRSGSVVVSMCVCRRMPFEQLLPLARREGWNLAGIAEATGCGGQCGLCRPYLERMLETGQTVFFELLRDNP
jgi:bacterioferritin-associated ferredoxin